VTTARAPRTRVVAAITSALATVLVSGCAALLPPAAPAASTAGARPPATGHTAPAGASATPTPRATTRAVVDSLPSSEALAVLETIPEPLAASERVPPPAAATAAIDSQRVSAAPDSGTVAAPDSSQDSTRAGIPVPTETRPLGDRPGAIEHMLAPDSAGAAPPAAATAPTAPAAAPPAAPAKRDTCFRIQIGARAAKAQATTLSSGASSQLLVPMVIERDRGLYKVRSRDCLSRATADALKARALASGFKGTFRFAGATP